jgi:hypothetical protein
VPLGVAEALTGATDAASVRPSVQPSVLPSPVAAEARAVRVQSNDMDTSATPLADPIERRHLNLKRGEFLATVARALDKPVEALELRTAGSRPEGCASPISNHQLWGGGSANESKNFARDTGDSSTDVQDNDEAVVDRDNCVVLHPAIERFLRAVRGRMKAHDVGDGTERPPFHPRHFWIDAQRTTSAADLLHDGVVSVLVHSGERLFGVSRREVVRWMRRRAGGYVRDRAFALEQQLEADERDAEHAERERLERGVESPAPLQSPGKKIRASAVIMPRKASDASTSTATRTSSVLRSSTV